MNDNAIQTSMNSLNYDVFLRTVEWELTPDGEIVANKPEYIPMIKEWLKTDWRHDVDALRSFIEKYGGVWIDEPLLSKNSNVE